MCSSQEHASTRILLRVETAPPQQSMESETAPDPCVEWGTFAALADAANVPLVTSDRGLLHARGQAPFPILKPDEFARSVGSAR
jgi:hypothetical protein